MIVTRPHESGVGFEGQPHLLLRSSKIAPVPRRFRVRKHPMPDKVTPEGAVRLYLMHLDDPTKLVDQTAVKKAEAATDKAKDLLGVLHRRDARGGRCAGRGRFQHWLLDGEAI